MNSTLSSYSKNSDEENGDKFQEAVTRFEKMKKHIEI